MKKNLLAALIATTLISGLAHATHYPAGNVTFNGTLSATTCVVALAGASTSGMTVDIGTVSTSAFTGQNSEAGATNFKVDVTGCPGSNGSSITLMFAGSADSSLSDAFANTASTGAATGVAVRLKEFMYPITPGQNTPVGHGLSGGATYITLSAQMVQTTATTPTTGAVRATPILNIVY